MPNVNKAIILGHLGNDPEIRTFDNGDQVANFSIATSKKWKDKQSGEEKKRTTWHHIVAYRARASLCAKYLHKGDCVYLEGPIETDEYTDKNGVDRKITKIVMEDIQFLSNRKSEDADTAKQMDNSSSAPGISFSDDIPF